MAVECEVLGDGVVAVIGEGFSKPDGFIADGVGDLVRAGQGAFEAG